MPAAECPGCEKLIDMDGFYCAPVITMFLSECGKAYIHGDKFMELVEVPISEVDLTGLEQDYPPKEIDSDRGTDTGMFVKMTRWSGYEDWVKTKTKK